MTSHNKPTNNTPITHEALPMEVIHRADELLIALHEYTGGDERFIQAFFDINKILNNVKPPTNTP